MALGIKQRLLAYHIERRDQFEGFLASWDVPPEPGSHDPVLIIKAGAVRQQLQDRYDLHAQAVEFLTEVKG